MNLFRGSGGRQWALLSHDRNVAGGFDLAEEFPLRRCFLGEILVDTVALEAQRVIAGVEEFAAVALIDLASRHRWSGNYIIRLEAGMDELVLPGNLFEKSSHIFRTLVKWWKDH